MKKKVGIPELNLPCFRAGNASMGPPELNMDDYYKAVVMLRQVMTFWPESPRGRSERFVIREDDASYGSASSKS